MAINFSELVDPNKSFLKKLIIKLSSFEIPSKDLLLFKISASLLIPHCKTSKYSPYYRKYGTSTFSKFISIHHNYNYCRVYALSLPRFSIECCNNYIIYVSLYSCFYFLSFAHLNQYTD